MLKAETRGILEADNNGPPEDDTNALNNIDDIRAMVEKRRNEEAETLKDKKAPVVSEDERVDSSFILSCLYSNEIGDGRLYAELNKGKFIFNKTSNEWYSWSGHHWERDMMNFSLAEVEKVSEQYLMEYGNISEQIKFAAADGESQKQEKLKKDQENILRRVSRLRSQRPGKLSYMCQHVKKSNISIW